MNEKQIAEKLNELDDVEIKFSSVTNKFYVSLRSIEIKNGCMLEGVCCHADTPFETLRRTFAELINANRIVKDAYGNRKEYRWKNSEFQEIKIRSN